MGERIIPWFLRYRGIKHEFFIQSRNCINWFKMPRLHPQETKYIPCYSYEILRNSPFWSQCNDSNQLIGDSDDSFDSIAVISCYRTNSILSSTHRMTQFRYTAIHVESEWIVSAIGFASRDSMTSVTRIKSILLGWELVLSVGAYDHPIPLSHDTSVCTLISSASIQYMCLFC